MIDLSVMQGQTCPSCGEPVTHVAAGTNPEGAWAMPCTCPVDVLVTATRTLLASPW